MAEADVSDGFSGRSRPERGALHETASAFIRAALEALREVNVVPTPVFHPHIAVGRDYFGDIVRGLHTYHEFERELEGAYPERFANPLERRGGEFASSYIFSFLEACIARCGRDRTFASDSPAVGETFDELLEVLGSTTDEIVCCRHVSHLAASFPETRVGDVLVVTETEGLPSLLRRIAQEIPGAPSAWNREDPRPYDPPHALLIVRASGDYPEPYEVSDRLSRRLERFLLLARLLTGGTVQSTYEISGATTLVARLTPTMRTFRPSAAFVRRSVRLTGAQAPAFAALDALIDTAVVQREGMVATSIDAALSRFNRSETAGDLFRQLAELATALEAALIGTEQENEGLALRLRSRAAALLATDGDPGRAVFEDVRILYGLRSRLVHGGQIKEKALHRDIGRISVVASQGMNSLFSLDLACAVDRMRDLVRRAILARLCLAEGPDALWPFDGITPVDAILSDDHDRAAWRARWRSTLERLGVHGAGDPSRSPVSYFSDEDR